MYLALPSGLTVYFLSQGFFMDTNSLKQDFHSFSFHPLIQDGIGAVGYQNPTPIQAQAIPLLLEGKDVMGVAQTGTGKTAAFVLPILQKLMVNSLALGLLKLLYLRQHVNLQNRLTR